MPWTLNTGTCLWQGDLFYSAGLHRNHVLATTNTGKIWRGFGKNAGEWTVRVEISKKEIPGSSDLEDIVRTQPEHTLSPCYSFHKSSYSKSCFVFCFFKPIFLISRVLNSGTCLWQGDLFYSAGLHRNHVLATANTGKIGRGFEQIEGEWSGRVQIGKKGIPGSERSMYGYILTYSRL